MTEKQVSRIELRVIEQKGTCGFGHKVGDVVVFDGRKVDGEVCLSALQGVLPKVYAMFNGVEFAWLEDKDVATHACPDAYNPVVFEIRRVWE